MDYLQYLILTLSIIKSLVLNLIINGLPSILTANELVYTNSIGFKPYYKWITFNINISSKVLCKIFPSFKPYYKWITFNIEEALKNNDFKKAEVLNLIINGLPSISLLKAQMLYLL